MREVFSHVKVIKALLYSYFLGCVYTHFAELCTLANHIILHEIVVVESIQLWSSIEMT